MISTLLEKKIAWSTAVQYFGKILQVGLAVTAIKLITNYLGTEEYGTYAKISETALFFATMGNLGIFGNTVRQMSTHEQSDRANSVFANALFVRIATAIPLFLIPIIIYPKVGIFFFVTALFFEYITAICDAAMQVHYLMGRATFALLLGRFTNLITILAIIHFNISKDANLFFIAPLIATFVTASLSLFFVKQKITIIWKLDTALMKTLLLSSIPFGLINIVNNLYFRFLPSYFAVKILQNAEYASYNVSLHISSYAALVSTFLMFSILPVLKSKPKELFEISKKILLALGAILIIFGSLLSPLLIKLLTGKEYFIEKLWFILPMMLILAAVSYLYDLVLINLFAFNQEKWFLKREILALALAGIFFLIGWQTNSIATIITGAIAGESLMVMWGLQKSKSML